MICWYTQYKESPLCLSTPASKQNDKQESNVSIKSACNVSIMIAYVVRKMHVSSAKRKSVAVKMHRGHVKVKALPQGRQTKGATLKLRLFIIRSVSG